MRHILLFVGQILSIKRGSQTLALSFGAFLPHDNYISSLESVHANQSIDNQGEENETRE